jgi:hypothetical protein
MVNRSMWIVLMKGQILSHTARYDNFSLNLDIPYIKGLFWVQRHTAAVDFMTNWSKQLRYQAAPDEIRTLSQLPKQGEKMKKSSGMSQSPRGDK